MARAMCMAVVCMMASIAVQAHQCVDGGECPSNYEPKSVVSLLQTKLELTVLKDVIESDMSAAQLRLHSDLLSARKSRQDALASFQKWDQSVSALETQLSEAMQGKEGQPVLYLKIVYCLLMLLLVLYIAQTGFRYESDRDKDMDPPWYQDGQCMTKVFAAGIGLWMVFGILMFTQFMHFTETRRHLSVIESMYLTIQIVTTIGYGDLTPTTNGGKVVTALYALTGVAVVGAIVQQFALTEFLKASEEDSQATQTYSEGHMLGKCHKYVRHVLPAVLSVAFGTLFYSMYPGEDKTPFEAFYMSIITLLTVGFGAYHPTTEAGKLVACFWMLIGVFYMGEAIVICSKMMLRKRRYAMTEAATMRLFAEYDLDKSGAIGRNEFLTFEFVRNGGTKGVAEKAFAKFDELLDSDGGGALDFQKFTKYVATLEFEYHTQAALDVLEKQGFTTHSTVERRNSKGNPC